MAEEGRDATPGTTRRATRSRADLRVRSPSGFVDIEVRPESASAEEREASVRELSRLVNDFQYRVPEARRAVAVLLAELRRVSPTDALRGDSSSSTRGRPSRRHRRGASVRRPGGTHHRAAPWRGCRWSSRSTCRRRPCSGPTPAQEAAPSSKTRSGCPRRSGRHARPQPALPHRQARRDDGRRDARLQRGGDAQGSRPRQLPDLVSLRRAAPARRRTPCSPAITSRGSRRASASTTTRPCGTTRATRTCRQQRTDPHVLQPGDPLTIPEVKAQPAANKPTEREAPVPDPAVAAQAAARRCSISRRSPWRARRSPWPARR